MIYCKNDMQQLMTHKVQQQLYTPNSDKITGQQNTWQSN